MKNLELELVLKVLLKDHLFLNKNQSVLLATTSRIFGTLISEQEVAIDTAKIESMKCWPSPNTLMALRGFLGLTRYYRRFIWENWPPTSRFALKGKFLMESNCKRCF